MDNTVIIKGMQSGIVVMLDDKKDYDELKEDIKNKFIESAKFLGKADIGISVTGIAGPGGGTEEKPVGLVYMGISTNNTAVTKKLNFKGTREKIRLATVNAVMSTLIEYLK